MFAGPGEGKGEAKTVSSEIKEEQANEIANNLNKLHAPTLGGLGEFKATTATEDAKLISFYGRPIKAGDYVVVFECRADLPPHEKGKAVGSVREALGVDTQHFIVLNPKTPILFFSLSWLAAQLRELKPTRRI